MKSHNVTLKPEVPLAHPLAAAPRTLPARLRRRHFGLSRGRSRSLTLGGGRSPAQRSTGRDSRSGPIRLREGRCQSGGGRRPAGRARLFWHTRQAPADRVYDSLKAVVLPDARAEEIFLYNVDLEGISFNAAQPADAIPIRPRGAGLILAEWAARQDDWTTSRRRLTDVRVNRSPRCKLVSSCPSLGQSVERPVSCSKTSNGLTADWTKTPASTRRRFVFMQPWAVWIGEGRRCGLSRCSTMPFG